MIIPLTITIPSPGLDLGYTVLDLDRAVFASFSTAGMVEVGNGVYAVSGGVEVPAAGGYVQVWTDDGGEPAEFVGEAAVEGAAGDPWSTALPGAYGAGTAGKLLSDLPSAGAGAIAHTITVDDGTNPLDGAEVWISTDEAGSNVVAGTLSTDALGRVTFMLDAGTYWKHVQLAGYNFTAKAFTVA